MKFIEKKEITKEPKVGSLVCYDGDKCLIIKNESFEDKEDDYKYALLKLDTMTIVDCFVNIECLGYKVIAEPEELQLVQV